MNTIISITIIVVFILDPSRDINKCPAIILADSRTASDLGRITFLILSIITMNGISIIGVPIGTMCINIEFVFFNHPNAIKVNHIGRDNLIENSKCEDDVNT